MTELGVGFQGSAALRVVLAGYRRAEVRQGWAPTTAPVPSEAARALGTPGLCTSAGQCVKHLAPPPRQSQDWVIFTSAGSRRTLLVRYVCTCVTPPSPAPRESGNARRRRVGVGAR